MAESRNSKMSKPENKLKNVAMRAWKETPD
jgi:hypothetical protein